MGITNTIRDLKRDLRDKVRELTTAAGAHTNAALHE